MTAAQEPVRQATAPDATGRGATGRDATGQDEADRDATARGERARGESPPDAAARDAAGGVASRATGVPGMVERQIRQAQDRGAFDNLAGAGLPLRDLGGPRDENWWLRQHLRREGVSGAAFLPPALALRKEIEDLPERVRELPTEAQVRLAVDRLNDRILDALRKPVKVRRSP